MTVRISKCFFKAFLKWYHICRYSQGVKRLSCQVSSFFFISTITWNSIVRFGLFRTETTSREHGKLNLESILFQPKIISTLWGWKEAFQFSLLLIAGANTLLLYFIWRHFMNLYIIPYTVLEVSRSSDSKNECLLCLHVKYEVFYNRWEL